MAATDSTELSASQKRELRKQRILARGEKRMAAILNVDGEKRQAPCIDGANNLVGNTGVQPTASEPIATTSTITPSSSKILDFTDDTSTDVQEPIFIPTKPKYVEFVDKSRFWIAVSLGLIFALSTLFYDGIGNIILPIFVLIATYEAFVFQTKKLFYPKNPMIISAVSAAGFNGDMVVSAGLILEILREISVDIVLAAFGFITMKLSLSSIVPLFY